MSASKILSISIELGIYKQCRKILKRSVLFFYIPVCERAHYEDCMNDIQIFKNEIFGEVRVAGTSDDPLFCLADVCRILEIKNVSDCKSRLKQEGVVLTEGVSRTTNQYGTTTEQKVMLTYINEQNLYKVIMRSDKPQAEPFQDWVCGEVLPSIRKTGEYSVKQALPKTYLEALKELVVVVEANEMLSLENKSMKPKAEYFDNLVDRNLLTNIRDTAKQIGIKEKDFVNYLLENKYMYRDKKKQLRPYAEHVPSLFQIKDYENNGHTGQQVLLTPKGKETFRLLVG